jgi:hypothetical protein
LWTQGWRPGLNSFGPPGLFLAYLIRPEILSRLCNCRSVTSVSHTTYHWDNCTRCCPRAIFAGCSERRGRVAQLGERGVRNAEVEGSNPFASTICFARNCAGRDPLTRPAPAEENAGDGPPSPPRGRGPSSSRIRLAMRCPKCRHENSERAQFCTRCHAPLRFTCPACRHVQDHGGKCDQCGVDFAKYATMLVFQAREGAQEKRRHTREKASLAKQILLIPLTGGLSLLKYVLSRLRRG